MRYGSGPPAVTSGRKESVMNKSALMHAAWRFVKEFGFSMSDALKQAWMQFKLRAKMTQGVVEFIYKKVNGEVRHACGTLLNPPKTKGVRTSYYGCQTYYDMGVQDWRCYRLENLLSIVK